MDSFYASVEIRDKPHLRELPVAVAGSSESRGVITTCNYVARKFGIKSGQLTQLTNAISKINEHLSDINSFVQDLKDVKGILENFIENQRYPRL